MIKKIRGLIFQIEEVGVPNTSPYIYIACSCVASSAHDLPRINPTLFWSQRVHSITIHGSASCGLEASDRDI